MENVSLVMGLRICYPRARLPDEFIEEESMRLRKSRFEVQDRTPSALKLT